MAKLANYYLSYLRRGIATRASDVDDASNPGKRIQVKLELEVRMGKEKKKVVKPMAVYGPGDVLGFDSNRIVVKTEPELNIGTFEPNYIPYIEFSEPDFLWRYSSAKSSDGKNWIPWLTLLVLRTGEGEEAGEFTFEENTNSELPKAIRLAPDAILPDLQESWRWAHVHVTDMEGLSQDQVEEAVLQNPQHAVCRLLCPRKLKAGKKYCAFVVPAYRLGVDAALGIENSMADRKKLAWNSPEEAPGSAVPYYFKWEFQTGWRGDFEYLLRQLVSRRLSNLGVREIDCTDPGYGFKKMIQDQLPEHEDRFVMEMEGALQSLDTKYQAWGMDAVEEYPNPLQRKFADLLNQAEIINENGEIELRVVPPVYGRWYVAGEMTDLNLDPVKKGWLNELNLDFRHRAAAGLGVQYVKDNQEVLMEAAWKQLSAVQEANRALNLGRFGRQVSMRMHQRLGSLEPGELLQLTLPAKSKIKVTPDSEKSGLGQPKTLLADYRDSKIPDTLTNLKAKKYLGKKNSERYLTRNMPLRSKAFKKERHIFERAADLEIIREELRPDGMNDQSIDAVFNQSSEDDQVAIVSDSSGEPPIAIDVQKVSGQLYRKNLNPQRTIEKKLSNRISRFRRWENQKSPIATTRERSSAVGETADPLRPILWHPEFHTAMYSYLRDKSKDLLIPGLTDIPPNTIALLAANQRFIESFMMGLNHEFAAELRWREFPTDMRGSYFRTFWDTTVYSVSPEERLKFQQSIIGSNLLLGIQSEYPGQYPTWAELGRAFDEQTDRTVARAYENALEKWLLTREEDKDIQQPASWGTASRLGAHIVPDRRLETGIKGSQDHLVILLRGDLLKKYPNIKIYLAAITKGNNDQLIPNLQDEGKRAYPIFEGAIRPDITFIGFPIIKEYARKYFIVFEEQVSEQRFGLDEIQESDQHKLKEQYHGLNDLSWQHFPGFGGEGYLDGLQPMEGLEPREINEQWNNAAFIAKAFSQNPVRAAIQLDRLIPRPSDFFIVIDASTFKNADRFANVDI